MSTQAIAQTALNNIENRINGLDIDTQSRIRNLSTAIDLFVKDHGSIGVMALNLATATTAVRVLS